LERLSYLLSNPKFEKSVKNLLIKHIEFIQKIIIYKKQNKKFVKTQLWKKYPFISNPTMLGNLIEDLEQIFGIKFDIFKN